jgi:regulator of ribonuclease activity A
LYLFAHKNISGKCFFVFKKTIREGFMETFKTTDLCDEYGSRARVLIAPFRDFGGKSSFAGLACTVKCFEDNSRVKELGSQNGEGKILVVDGGASQRCALLGDIIGLDLVKNGWQGIVIYGCVRDSADLRKLPIAIKALGVSPRRSTKRGEGVVGEAIEIGGQVIENGDQLYADEDGIIILDAKS